MRTPRCAIAFGSFQVLQVRPASRAEDLACWRAILPTVLVAAEPWAPPGCHEIVAIESGAHRRHVGAPGKTPAC